MSGLLYLDLYTTKVCMGFSTSYCCDDPVTEIKRFKVNVIRDGDSNNKVLIEYPMFEINDSSQMCVLLDSSMSKLFNGRYVFEVVFDDCVNITRVPFMWGGKPVLTSVDVEESALHSLEGCDDMFEAGMNTGDKMPKNCCTDETEVDCGTCDDECVPLAEHVPNGTLSETKCSE